MWNFKRTSLRRWFAGTNLKAAKSGLTVTQRQPAAGRSDEGAADGDDGAEPEGDQGLVPEQAVQGKHAGTEPILKILLKFFKDKKIQNRMIEKQLQGEKVTCIIFPVCRLWWDQAKVL